MLKKISTSILLLTVAHSSFLAADYGDSSKNSNMHGHAHSDMKSGGSNPPMKEITPPAGPMVSDGADVFISASYILWKTSTGNTDILTESSQSTLTLNNLQFNEGSKSTNSTLSYDWDSGFKVGLGVNLPMDGWALYADYTWLRPNASVTILNSGNTPLSISSAVGDPQLLPGGRATRIEDFNYNNINLIIGRNFYVSKCFTLNPYAGLLGTWQKWDITNKRNNVKRLGIDDNSGSLLPYRLIFDKVNVEQNNSIWGIGILAGFDMGMYLTNEFSMYANISGSGIFQSYQRNDSASVSGVYTDSIALINRDTSVSKRLEQHQTNYKFAPLLCFELGLKYEAYFDEDQYCFTLQAGWESKWYSGWLYDSLERNTNDLTLGGLEVKARFDF